MYGSPKSPKENVNEDRKVAIYISHVTIWIATFCYLSFHLHNSANMQVLYLAILQR